MNTLIIEDEHLPAQALQKLIKEIAPEFKILATLQSIEESIEWLHANPMPQLIFADIHLADGSSFSIFERIPITCPLIFTTAYDEYALKAFQVNSIDYLLKPITKESLQRAINKFNKLTTSPANYHQQTQIINQLAEKLAQANRSYKTSLLIARKDTLIPLPVTDIAYIYIEKKTVKAVDFNNKSHTLDYTLDELSTQLNPKHFYRANRQYIIARTAIKNIAIWFGNRIAINLSIHVAERILVSRTHVKDFKNWLTQ